MNEMVSHVQNTISDYQQLVQMIAQFISAVDKQIEATRATATAFTYLTGSAQSAQKALSDLAKTNAAAAYGTQQIDNVVQHLLMLGKTADQAKLEVTKVADGLAAMGHDASTMQAIVDQMEKIRTEGRVTKEDIDALVNDGLPAWKAIADGMGTSITEAQRRVQAGAVSGQAAMKDLMNGLDQFAGASGDRAQNLSAQWERLSEHIKEAFGPLIDFLASVLSGINEVIEGTSKLTDMMQALQKTVQSFGNAFSNLGTVGAIPHAAGIIDSPTTHVALVGEQGPELMMVPQGASIYPADMTQRMLASGANASFAALPSLFSGEGGIGSITLNVTHLIKLDSRVLAQQTIPHLAPLIRQAAGSRV